jgi:hypothetical protein
MTKKNPANNSAPDFHPSLLKYDEQAEPDMTDEEYNRWVGLSWEKHPARPLTPEQEKLAEEFEKQHELYSPPWDNPLAQEEAELIRKAATDRGVGSKLYASFHISCLAAMYERSPTEVHQIIVDHFNNGSTEWTAFDFRFTPKYDFDSDVVFPRSGEVRKSVVYKTRNGKCVNPIAAQEANLSGIPIEKKLRKRGTLKMWTPPSELPLFSKRLDESLRVTPQEINELLAEVLQKRDAPTRDLDVIRIALWNKLAWAAFGPGARLGVLLVPSQTKIETVERLALKNQIVIALGGSIGNT